MWAASDSNMASELIVVCYPCDVGTPAVIVQLVVVVRNLGFHFVSLAEELLAPVGQVMPGCAGDVLQLSCDGNRIKTWLSQPRSAFTVCANETAVELFERRLESLLGRGGWLSAVT